MSATDVARSVVSALVADGVREVVLAPGSRNAPLSFAAYDAAEAGLLRLHTRIDERTAGFLALGLTKGGSRAAVVCTSGTAVANLHPAVLEAHHAGVALVVVTADRPDPAARHGRQPDHRPGRDLRATRADPRRGRGRAVPLGPGLVHLNVQLDDPLVPPDRWRPPTSRAPRRAPGARLETRRTLPRRWDRARSWSPGTTPGPRARALAAEAGWPLLAEPSSGARTGPALRTYRLLLAT